MGNIQSTINQLEELDKKYHGDDVVLSTNMSLSFPQYTSSSRMIMIANQLKQCVIPLKTEKPRVFTNYENEVGNLSDYNVRADSDCVVKKIIHKFPKSESPVKPYIVFMQNTKTGEYIIYHRNDVMNFPEKYGCQMDNHWIDQLKEGDIVNEGDTLFRPTSYDKYGNWGFGKNIPFICEINDDTIDDAVLVSQTLNDTYTSVETEPVKIMANENDIFLNWYGDDDNYKVIPDIGERTKQNQICIKRIIRKSQIFYDMSSANTKKKLDGDITYYGDGVIVDIDIYSNKERKDIPDTIFNRQILEYLDQINAYWEEIRDYTQELLDANEKVSVEIRALNKRAKELLDPDIVIRDESNSAFSNFVIYVQIKRTPGLSFGQKITGRYGNKGVISKVVPDHEMPHVIETGETVHVVFNALGPVGRLCMFPIMEQAITFICDQVLEEIKKTDKIKEKEELLFKLLNIFNKSYFDWVLTDYKATCRTKKEKEDYFKILEEEGIYMHIPPYWYDGSVYEAIKKCFDEFKFIHLYTTAFYDTVSERWVPMINKQIVGTMYIMKQKQSAKKGLIARSTGSVSKLGVPCKSDNAKKHLLPYSQQPIRQGEQEFVNKLMSLSANTIAKKAVYVRSSPIGRMELGKNLFTYPLGIDDIDITGNMTNCMVDVLNCYMLIMGRELVFEYDVLNLDESNPDAIKEHVFQNRVYYCTTDEIKQIVARYYGKLHIDECDDGYILLGTEADVEEFLDEIVAETKDTIIDQLEY